MTNTNTERRVLTGPMRYPINARIVRTPEMPSGVLPDFPDGCSSRTFFMIEPTRRDVDFRQRRYRWRVAKDVVSVVLTGENVTDDTRAACAAIAAARDSGSTRLDGLVETTSLRVLLTWEQYRAFLMTGGFWTHEGDQNSPRRRRR